MQIGTHQADSTQKFKRISGDEKPWTNINMNVSPISGEGGFSNPVSESSSSPKKVRKTSLQQMRKQNSNLDNTISRSKHMPQIQQAKHRYGLSESLVFMQCFHVLFSLL